MGGTFAQVGLDAASFYRLGRLQEVLVGVLKYAREQEVRGEGFTGEIGLAVAGAVARVRVAQDTARAQTAIENRTLPYTCGNYPQNIYVRS